MVEKPISSTRFYTDVLGADLRNSRWSWGAYDSVKDRLYLRVWDDELITDGETSFALVLRTGGKSTQGRNERLHHLDLITAGAEAYAVLCTPDGPRTNHPRKIRKFDRQTLLRLGRLVERRAGVYAEIVGRIPVQQLTQKLSSATTLDVDIRALLRQKGVTATEKDALVSARIGQGAFRIAVLALWEGCCAVSGCRTREAIRASHIKPWRLANNEERLDPRNGIPLVATLDALFDAGLIAFANDGTMLVSEALPADERKLLQLSGSRLRQRPEERTARYLSEHRARCGFPV